MWNRLKSFGHYVAITIFLQCLISAHAQTVQQSGVVTNSHPAMWTTTGVIQDGGPATAGLLTNLGITANGGLPFCINTAAITGAYDEFCLYLNSTTGAFLTLQNFNGAAAVPLSATVNGVTTQLFNSAGSFVAGGGSGTVTTTGSPSNGNLTKFSGATSITNADLTGDVTTSGGVATSIASNAVTTVKLNAAAVTYAKVQNGASTGLLGVNNGSAPTEVAVGSGLTLSGGTLSASGGGGSATIVAPQGRLTLSSGSPVMTSDQTAKSQVYYDCYAGKNVPYYTGSADALDTIGSCEVSLTMQTSGTGVTNNAGVFDIWWEGNTNHNICVATNGSGGGWASDTAGSNTARGTGYSEIHNTRGYWTNQNSVAHCYNGTSDYGSITADKLTYLGTVYTTASGQTGVQYRAAAAAGGSNAVMGLYNGYNRIKRSGRSQDSTASYTYQSSVWRGADNSSSNRITVVDGLQQSAIRCEFRMNVESGAATYATVGCNLDAITGAPSVIGVANTNNGSSVDIPLIVYEEFAPQIGLHFVQAMESTLSGTNTTTYVNTLSSVQVQQLLLTYED